MIKKINNPRGEATVSLLLLVAILGVTWGLAPKLGLPPQNQQEINAEGDIEAGTGVSQSSRNQLKATSTPHLALTTAIYGYDLFFPGSSVTSTSMTAEQYCIGLTNPDCITSWPSGGGADIEILDEGGSLTSSVESINFVGAGVEATNSGADVTVTINGGGSSDANLISTSTDQEGNSFSVTRAPVTTPSTTASFYIPLDILVDGHGTTTDWTVLGNLWVDTSFTGLLRADGGLVSVDSTDFVTEAEFDSNWDDSFNSTSTWHAFDGLWNTAFNNTTTWASFSTNWDTQFNATSTWHAFNALWATQYNATTTLNGFTDNSSNWNTAFGWGDHSSAGYYAAANFNADWDTRFIATSTWQGDFLNSGNSTSTATSTAQGFKALNLLNCDTIDTDAEGHFKCGTDANDGGSGGGYAWTDSTHFGLSVSATTSPLWLQGSVFSLLASSTAVFDHASTSQLTVADASTLWIGTDLIGEYVADTAGSMFTGNTETLITVTYQDADNTVDLVVNNDLSAYSNASSNFFDTAGTGLTSSGSTVNAIGGTGITSNANDLAFDATELDALTWDGGTLSSILWTWNLSGTDPTINFSSAAVGIGGTVSSTAGISVNGLFRADASGNSTTSNHLYAGRIGINTNPTDSTQLRIIDNSTASANLIHLSSTASWPGYLVSGGGSATGVDGVRVQNSSGSQFNFGITGSAHGTCASCGFIWNTIDNAYTALFPATSGESHVIFPNGGLAVGSLANEPDDNELIVGLNDAGSYSIQGVQGYFSDYGVALGGWHIGGTADPGTDNLIVDGTTVMTGQASTTGRFAMEGGQVVMSSTDRETLVLSGDILTIDEDNFMIVVQSQSGTTDNLDQIAGGKDGQRVCVIAAFTHTITIRPDTTTSENIFIYNDASTPIDVSEQACFLRQGASWYLETPAYSGL